MRIIGKILLFIGKLLGILLLLVIGLFLLVLLVPIRYRFCGKALPGERFLKGQVSFLFHLIHVSFTWQESGVSYRLRLFGIPFFPGKRKEKNGSVSKETVPEEEKEPERPEASDSEEGESFSDLAKAEIEKNLSRMEKPENAENLSKLAEAEIRKLLSETPEAEEEAPSAPSGEAEAPVKDSDFQKEPEVPPQETDGSTEKVWEKFQAVSHKIRQVKEFLQKEEHKQTFDRIRREFKRLFRHLRPVCLRIKGVLGFEDPALTGKAFGVLALLIPFYQNAVQVTPDFSGSRLEGEFFLKGRVRLGTITASAVRLFMDKNIRTWIRKAW
ncbi:MAG: DUF2953 domain-containing protein [Lachnospiraceae bacterium]|nr:DUF2953 domain-containing protein [Lachnospiraceae bacterium]